jgi:hypothetical protein
LIPQFQNQKKLPKYGKYFDKKGNIKAIESISDANFALNLENQKTIRMN